MKKQIIALIVLIIIAAGAWYVVKNNQVAPGMQTPETIITDDSMEGDLSDDMTDDIEMPGTVEGTWTLVSFNGMAVTGEAAPTVTFADGRLSAKFCNQMGGDYAAQGGTMTAPQLVSTMMYCTSPEYLMNAESTFGTVLANGAAYAVTANTLRIDGPADENFTFVR